jgi:hypothetical protein
MNEKIVWVTPEELVERWFEKFAINIKITTLSQWRHQRKGPRYSMLLGKVRYNIKDIEDYEKEMIRSKL